MIKFQIGKLTFKNFLLHWGVSFFLTIIGFKDILKDNSIKDLIIILGTASIFPGMLGSILLIELIKIFIRAIKEKNYTGFIAGIIFIIIFTKYFFKL